MPNYLSTSEIVKTIGGLSIFSSGSTALLPTSSNAATAAELTINVSSSLPTNIINNTVLNPYIRFTVISGSNRTDGINQDVAIRFFTQSHVQSKYTSSVATTTIGYVESSSLYLTSSANEEITFIDIKYSNPTNGISLGQAIHNALTGSTIFQEGLSASQTSTGKNHITTIHYNNFKGVVPSSTLELYTGSGEIPLSNNLSVSYSDTGSGALNFIPQPQLHFASASFHLRLNTTSPGDFEITQGVSSSGFIRSSNTNDRLLFFSGSGRIGVKTRDPQVDFDISAEETQFQVPGARKGLRINTEGNIESFNKEAASATTGSEFVLRYSRGTVITQTNMNLIFGAGSFSSNDEAQNFFNDLAPDRQSSVLEILEREGFNNLPDVGDSIGSIRFVAESGSTTAGEGFNDRITGEAASIQAKVHSVDSTGVRGDLIFNVADKTGRAVQRMVIDAGDEHQLSGSLNVGGTDAQGARIAMRGTTGNLQAGFFRVGASSDDLKIGRMLLHDDGTQKVQLSAKGKSFIAGTSGTGTSGTFLGINTQNPTRALQVEGSISCSNNFFLDGEIKRVTHITASGDISASGNITTTEITASGNISASGDIFANNLEANQSLQVNDKRITFNNNVLTLPDTGLKTHGAITASGNISASGTIITNEITASNIDLPGDNKSITFDNATKLIGDHSVDGFQIRTQDATPIVFKTNGNNIRATIAADGEATFAGVLNSTKLNTGQGDNELYAMNQDVETTDGVQFATLRLTSTTDASATSTGHAFQAGLTNSTNVIIDSNEIMARNNGATADLHLNPDGGAVSFNNSVSTKVRIQEGHVTASGNISSSGTIIANKLEADALVSHVGDANTGLQFASDTVVIEGNDVAIGTFATNRIELNKPITCSSSVSASGTITGLTGSFSVLVGDTSQDTSLEVDGSITASGNISASGQIFSNTYYQWEATGRADTDDDSNWQGPNSKGLMSNEDWNLDYGTDYDGTSNNAESRLYMNTGWWVPHGANYSASIKSMDIYVQPNSNLTYADADFFSCSLWYSHNSDLQSELNHVDSNSGTFVQRHGASVDSSQCKASDDKFFKYNNYHVSQSINLDLAPGSMLFPRIKTGGTNNFSTNVYWVIHYCKKPL